MVSTRIVPAKWFLPLAVVLGLGWAAAPASATTLFFDDFEGDLSAWTGKTGDVHHGVIVPDPEPLPLNNDVLAFTQLNSAGDIFTIAAFSDPGGLYVLSFDYRGSGGDVADPDFGGFAGYSYDFPGSHVWLAGTQNSYPDLAVYLADNSGWNHYEIAFSAPGSIHVMLEDFSGSPLGGGGIAGDALFDNVRLSTPETPVPEPGTLVLLGSGLTSLALRRRRNRGRSH